MGKGRKPLPTTIRLLQGNRSKRPINHAEPKLERGAPDCPGWLDDYAREEWDFVVPYLESAGVLRKADRSVLIGYCQAVSTIRHTTAILDKEGLTVTNDKGNMSSHPAAAQRNAAWLLVCKFEALLGLSPSSSSRIKLPEKNGPKDQLAEFLSA